MIYLAAVNYFDPLGREALVNRLKGLRVNLTLPAGFVAVEYDREQYKQIVRQRLIFGELLASEWPDISFQEINALAQSLAYEADAHCEVFPEADIVSLDRGSDLLPGYASAQGRLNLYKNYLETYLRKHPDTSISGQIVQLISRQSHEGGRSPEATGERDVRFAEIVLEKLPGLFPGVVIVGAYHAEMDLPGSMASIIRDRNVEICQI